MSSASGGNAFITSRSFATTDPEQAFRAMSEAMPAATIRPPAQGEFAFASQLHRLVGLDLVTWSFRGRVMGGRSADAGGIAVVAPSSGRYDWSAGEESGNASAPFLMRQGIEYDGDSEDMVINVLRLDQDHFDRMVAAMLGVDEVRTRFHSSVPMTVTLGVGIEREIRFHCKALERQLVRESPLLLATTRRLITAFVLQAFPVFGLPDRNRSSGQLLTATERAGRFIDDYASLPITVTDIARHVGLGEAELRRGFEVWFTMSPETALRRARTSAAHVELAAGDPDQGTTLEEVAARWGFPSADALSAAHRDAYGQTAEQALHGDQHPSGDSPQ